MNSKMLPPSPTSNIYVVASIVFYFLCSLSLVFLNKIILSGSIKLDAAIFLTWTQIVITVLLSYLLCMVREYSNTLTFLTKWEYNVNTAMKIWPVTLSFCGMIIFNNLCLQYVDVTFYQIARSLTIVFNIIISYYFFNDSTSYKCMFACGIVVVGYVLGVDGELNFSYLGVIYGFASSIFVSLYSLCVKRYMKTVLNDDSWLLLYYNNVNSMILMPFVSLLFGEFKAIMTSQTLYTWNSAYLLIVAGLIGTLMNIASFFQIKYTSALTHNVSGTAKACVQSIIAWYIYQNPLSTNAITGLVASIVGSFMYGKFRYDEGEEAKRAKAASEAVDNVEMEKLTSGTPKQ